MTQTTFEHPSLDLIELSLLGRISEAEQDTLEEHTLVCDSCRDLMEDLDQEIGLIRKYLS